MAARLMPRPQPDERATELRALDDGANIPGGRFGPAWIDAREYLEIVTWNTGEASDLRRYGNKTHAEAQFFDFIRDRTFNSIEIEISHSPCTACTDMLAGWLRNVRRKGASSSSQPNRRVGNRVYISSAVITPKDVSAVIRWGKLYDTPPQATTWHSLLDLHKAGWQLAAPGTALPSGTGDAPVRPL